MVITRNCPNCKGNNVVMNCTTVHCLESNIVRYAIFRCPNCFYPYLILFKSKAPPQTSSSGAFDSEALTKQFGIKIITEYPKKNTSIPDHLPPNIETFYSQGVKSIETGCWDAAGMVLRKTIDITTKDIGSNKRGNLKTRIDALNIPDMLKDWAHIIRVEGNEAAHEEDPYTMDEAEQLLAFSEIFLQYLYTLPEEIKLKQSSKVDI